MRSSLLGVTSALLTMGSNAERSAKTRAPVGRRQRLEHLHRESWRRTTGMGDVSIELRC